MSDILLQLRNGNVTRTEDAPSGFSLVLETGLAILCDDERSAMASKIPDPLREVRLELSDGNDVLGHLHCLLHCLHGSI